MKPLTFAALRLLADGEFHSGEAMARSLGVCRASIWNALHDLERADLELFKVRGRGYRLPRPLILLDREQIIQQLGPQAKSFSLEIDEAIESTNTSLMQRASAAPNATVIATEWQTQGRGRRGRTWHAAPCSSLMFSLLWRFQQGAAALGGLSLAVGIAVVRGLSRCGVKDVGLKWPNDVLWRGRKLAGILVEMQGDALGPSVTVIGIGLNCSLGETLRTRIDQPAVDLETILEAPVDRNRLLAFLLIELESVLVRFAREGFASLRGEWQAVHVFHDKRVKLTLADGKVVSGLAQGVAADGALLLLTATGLQRFHSGEVNLRAIRPATPTMKLK